MKISWLLDKFLYAYQLQQFKCSVYVIMNRRFFSVAKKKKVKMEEGCEENAIGVEGDDLDTGIAN